MIITPHSSITTRLISTKLHILCPPYTQLRVHNIIGELLNIDSLIVKSHTIETTTHMHQF